MSEPLERIADELWRMRLILERQRAIPPARRTPPAWRAVLFWLTLSAVTLVLWQIVGVGRGADPP